MALPKIRIDVGANTKDAEAGLNRVEDRLDRLGAQARRTGAQMGRGGAFGRGIQNASYQLGDFAVQVGAGTSASIALGQQLPQLLGGFGILGAVLGAAVAVAVPLVRVLREMKTESADLTQLFGTLQPAAQAVVEGFRTMAEWGEKAAKAVINNLDRIITIAATAAALFAGRWVAAFVAARVAAFSLVGALTALRAALIRTGIGALVIAAGELVYQFTRLVEGAGGFGAALGLLADVATEVWTRIKDGINLIPLAMKAGAAAMKAWFLGALEDMLQAFQDLTWSIAEGLNNLFGTNLRGSDFEAIRGIGTGSLSRARSEAEVAQGSASAELNSALGGLTAPLESVQRIKEVLASIKAEGLDLPTLLGAGDSEDEDGGSKAKQAADQAVSQLERIKKAQDMLRSAARRTFTAMGNFLQQFAGKSKAAAIAVIAIQKGLAIAQIISNTSAAAARALAELGPVYGAPVAAGIKAWGAAEAALVAATGIAQAMNSGGGGGGGGGGVAAIGAQAQNAGSVQSQQSGPQQSRTLTLIGDRFNRSQAEEIARFMNDGTDDGLVIRGRR